MPCKCAAVLEDDARADEALRARIAAMGSRSVTHYPAMGRMAWPARYVIRYYLQTVAVRFAMVARQPLAATTKHLSYARLSRSASQSPAKLNCPARSPIRKKSSTPAHNALRLAAPGYRTMGTPTSGALASK